MSNIVKLNHTTLPKGEIVLYQPDETIRLEVMVEGETVWLKQAQMVELFQTTKQNVSLHINNVFREGELEKPATVKEYLTVQNEGEREVFRNVKHYNLDVIISVGYRVKSLRGTAFRKWATKVLKEYMLKGIVIQQVVEMVENFAIETSLRITKTETEITKLKIYVESVLSDFNEINEDTRMQLELISEQLAELQARNKWINKPRNPIGFVQPKKDKQT